MWGMHVCASLIALSALQNLAQEHTVKHTKTYKANIVDNASSVGNRDRADDEPVAGMSRDFTWSAFNSKAQSIRFIRVIREIFLKTKGTFPVLILKVNFPFQKNQILNETQSSV